MKKDGSFLGLEMLVTDLMGRKAKTDFERAMVKRSASLPILKEKIFPFSTQIPVLIQHINYGKHLGHDSLVSLLHEARLRFLKEKGLSEITKEGISLIMVELYVTYKSEVFYGEVLIFEVDLIREGMAHCEFLYRVQEKISQRVVAEAVTKMAFYDSIKKKVVRGSSWRI